MIEEDLEERIERDEAWLRGLSSPAPSHELIRQTKAAMRDDFEAQRLLGGTNPEPGALLLERTRGMIRRELAHGRRAPAPFAWWGRWGVAAAACLVIAVGVMRMRSGSPIGVSVDPFLVFDELSELLNEGDVQLALLSNDLDELDELDGLGWGDELAFSDSDAELSDLADAIDLLGEDEPLGWDDQSGGDV